MQRHFFRTAPLAVSLLTCSGLHAAAKSERALVIDEALAQIKAEYVHPDRYPAIEQNVRRHHLLSIPIGESVSPTRPCAPAWSSRSTRSRRAEPSSCIQTRARGS